MYADLERRALVLRRFDREIAVASVEDLIAMKRTTGREKDAAHLVVLLDHLRRVSGTLRRGVLVPLLC